MKIFNRTLAVALAVSAIGIVGAQQQQGTTAPQAKAPVVSFEERMKMVKEVEGKTLPAWEMKLLDDKVLKSDDLKGKVVVVDFWATWCGPCKSAAPKVNAIYNEFKDKGLVVIGANLAERGKDGAKIQTKDNAVAYVNEHKYDYTFTYANDELGKQWKVPGYPTFFIIGSDGVLKEVMVGFNEKRMRELVSELTSAAK